MDCTSRCRLCLKVVSPSEPSYKVADNPTLKEAISTLLGGKEGVCPCGQQPDRKGSDLCNKPRLVCVQCKLDLEFCMEFAARARTINARLGGTQCPKFSGLQVQGLQEEVVHAFSSLYQDLTNERRVIRSMQPTGQDPCKLNEILTKQGKVAIPPLPPRQVSMERSKPPEPKLKFHCGFGDCQSVFTVRSNYQSHVESYHTKPETVKPAPSGVQVDTTDDQNSLEDKSTCNIVVKVDPDTIAANFVKSSDDVMTAKNPVVVDREGKKVYACRWEGCVKTYRSGGYLVDHERVHKGERPFACRKCPKSFFRMTDLKKHTLVKACKTTKPRKTNP